MKDLHYLLQSFTTDRREVKNLDRDALKDDDKNALAIKKLYTGSVGVLSPIHNGTGARSRSK